MVILIIVLPPATIGSLIVLAKYIVKCVYKYKTTKLLLASGKKHGLVTDDQVMF